MGAPLQPQEVVGWFNRFIGHSEVLVHFFFFFFFKDSAVCVCSVSETAIGGSRAEAKSER